MYDVAVMVAAMAAATVEEDYRVRIHLMFQQQWVPKGANILNGINFCGHFGSIKYAKIPNKKRNNNHETTKINNRKKLMSVNTFAAVDEYTRMLVVR